MRNIVPNAPNHHRATSCDAESTTSGCLHDGDEAVEGNWSSDCSNSDDDDQSVTAAAPVSLIRIALPLSPIAAKPFLVLGLYLQFPAEVKSYGVQRIIQYIVGSTANSSTFYVSHY